MVAILPVNHLVDDAERYRTLLEINNAIITHLNEHTLFRATCEALHRVVPYDAAGLALPGPDDRGFRFFALEGDLPADRFAVGDLVDPKGSCFGAAFEEQRAIVRGDLNVERVFASDERLHRNGMRSYCTVPLLLQGRSVGALSVASRFSHRYSAVEAEFLRDVANQLALAIVNMQAYEEIAALRRRLQIENRHLRNEMSEAESQVLLAENAALLGRFAAALSHELNSPIGVLRSAISSSRTIEERERSRAREVPPPGETEARSALRDAMDAAVARLSEVVSRMKRLTNLDRREVLMVDLNHLLRDVLGVLTPTLKPALRVELDLGTLPRLELKPQQMSAIFMGVLQNAVDDANEASLVRVTTREAEHEIVVHVGDDGRGLSPEEIEGVFEPSFRVKGTRIATGNWSLFGARQMARAHGGRIDVESSPGDGTSVTVRLPLRARAAQPTCAITEAELVGSVS